MVPKEVEVKEVVDLDEFRGKKKNKVINLYDL
jgi:hypothetical protein